MKAPPIGEAKKCHQGRHPARADPSAMKAPPIGEAKPRARGAGTRERESAMKAPPIGEAKPFGVTGRPVAVSIPQ